MAMRFGVLHSKIIFTTMYCFPPLGLFNSIDAVYN